MGVYRGFQSATKYLFKGKLIFFWKILFIQHYIELYYIDVYQTVVSFIMQNYLDHTLSIWLEMEFTSDIFLKTSVCADYSHNTYFFKIIFIWLNHSGIFFLKTFQLKNNAQLYSLTQRSLSVPFSTLGTLKKSYVKSLLFYLKIHENAFSLN